jgi:hypothetical protein
MRTLAAGAGCVALAVALSGCAALNQSTELWSLKDELVPKLGSPSAGSPTVTKVAHRVPARPPSSRRLDAKTKVDGGATGCGSDTGCLARLKALLDDQTRKWIGEPQLPPEHATGVRQFAYRALRTELSCKQLALAIDELAAAKTAFRASVPGVAPAQAARVRALDGQVEAELRAERAKRCET